MVYRQNFYSVPWRLIGQSVAVRTTETEIVIHDKAFVEAARHRLLPRTAMGQRSPCKDHEPPRRRATGGRNCSTQRFAEFGGDGHAVLEGLLASQPVRQEPGRTRPVAGGGLPARTSRGAGAGRALRRVQPASHRAHPRGAGRPKRRWTRWPTTIRATWTGSSTASRHRRDRPPTIKPCWARGSHDGDTTNARDPTATRPDETEPPRRRQRELAMTTSPRAFGTLGVAMIPRRSTRRSRRRKRIVEPPGVPAPAARRPGRGQAPAGTGTTTPRGEVPRD